MRTLIEFVTADGETMSLEDEDGELFLSHLFSNEGPRSVIPVSLNVLERMTRAARSAGQIDAREQNVIAFPVRAS